MAVRMVISSPITVSILCLALGLLADDISDMVLYITRKNDKWEILVGLVAVTIFLQVIIVLVSSILIFGCPACESEEMEYIEQRRASFSTSNNGYGARKYEENVQSNNINAIPTGEGGHENINNNAGGDEDENKKDSKNSSRRQSLTEAEEAAAAAIVIAATGAIEEKSDSDTIELIERKRKSSSSSSSSASSSPKSLKSHKSKHSSRRQSLVNAEEVVAAASVVIVPADAIGEKTDSDTIMLIEQKSTSSSSASGSPKSVKSRKSSVKSTRSRASVSSPAAENTESVVVIAPIYPTIPEPEPPEVTTPQAQMVSDQRQSSHHRAQKSLCACLGYISVLVLILQAIQAGLQS